MESSAYRYLPQVHFSTFDFNIMHESRTMALRCEIQNNLLLPQDTFPSPLPLQRKNQKMLDALKMEHEFIQVKLMRI